MEACRMCDIVRSIGSVRGSDVARKIIWETDEFVVVPSLGALVDGHVMLVTRAHQLCTAATDPRSAVLIAAGLDAVRDVVRQTWGSAVTFEHGPSVAGTSVGCTVDHAHVHVLPLEGDFEHHIVGMDSHLDWAEVPDIDRARRLFDDGRPYLYVRFDDGRELVATGESIPSQFFRRAVVGFTGDSRAFDWRLDPRVDLVQATLTSLGGAFERRETAWGTTIDANLRTA